MSRKITARSLAVCCAVTALSMICGNFIYQAFTAQDWVRAVERSWFQVAAILVTFLMVIGAPK